VDEWRIREEKPERWKEVKREDWEDNLRRTEAARDGSDGFHCFPTHFQAKGD